MTIALAAASGDVILNGSLLLAVPLALLAGLVSFASPCVLPLVPGYLGMLASTGQGRLRAVSGTLLFVLGFAVVFVAFGAAFGGLGSLLVGQALDWLLRGLGLVVFVFGLVLTGRVAWLQRTFKPHGWRATGWAGSVLLGVTFGLGWTPCIGPTLAAVLTLASDQADASRGALLATSYALGLGLPFVALAAGFAWAARSSAWLRRHLRALNLLGGVMLMALGVLLITGVWQTLNSWLISEVVGYFQLGI